MSVLLPYGDRAVLVECGDEHPGGFAEALRRTSRWGSAAPIEVVPGARTVLLTFADPVHLADIESILEELATATGSPDDSNVIIEIGVDYDGEDLESVAHETGRSIDEVVEAHTTALHTVDFCGFAPGFAYMSGVPDWLHVARLATPRTKVPAGSVAIAAGWSAVYPGASPGGWRLIGRTDVVVFDPDRSAPALLPPGAKVRFVAR